MKQETQDSFSFEREIDREGVSGTHSDRSKSKGQRVNSITTHLCKYENFVISFLHINTHVLAFIFPGSSNKFSFQLETF